MKSFETIAVLKRSSIAAITILAALALQADDTDKDSTIRTEGKTARGQGTVVQEQLTASSFIKGAMQANQAEIALADSAIQKSQNAEVKQFAEHIRKDHTEANQKLQEIAQKNSITADAELDAKHKEKQTQLEQKTGEEFDKEFAKCMLKDHAKGISKYQQAARLQDADVKIYAQETLPKLRQHLQHAKTVAKAVGVDEATIAAYSVDTPGAVGGTIDRSEAESGASQKEQHPEKDKDSDNDK
jgi:putative membrane protein